MSISATCERSLIIMRSHVNILFAPHPPILLHEVGHGREEDAALTLSGMGQVASVAAQEAPETIIFISPHGNMFRNAVSVLDAEELSGDFSDFGARGMRFEKQVDVPLMRAVMAEFREVGLSFIRLDRAEASRYGLKPSLDHGCMVPMYFIDRKYPRYKIVHITPGFLPHRDLYAFGAAISRAVASVGRKVLILASGDLAHSDLREGPPPPGSPFAVFDKAVVDAVRRADVKALVDMPASVWEPGQQCGLKSYCIALGALDSCEVCTELFSYESPFGVGYMCGRARGCGDAPSLLEGWQADSNKDAREGADPYVALARAAVRAFVERSERLEWNAFRAALPSDVRERLEKDKAGAFVSLHRFGDLRGCIGTITATQRDLAHEIIHSAVEACSEDPRFEPVTLPELGELDVKVDILHPAHKVNGLADLDAQRYGVIVQSGWKRGLLLPALEGVDTPEQQVSIAMRKGGIAPSEKIELYRFEVERHEDK
jgi:MEMO1 family protein